MYLPPLRDAGDVGEVPAAQRRVACPRVHAGARCRGATVDAHCRLAVEVKGKPHGRADSFVRALEPEHERPVCRRAERLGGGVQVVLVLLEEPHALERIGRLLLLSQARGTVIRAHHEPAHHLHALCTTSTTTTRIRAPEGPARHTLCTSSEVGTDGLQVGICVLPAPRRFEGAKVRLHPAAQRRVEELVRVNVQQPLHVVRVAELGQAVLAVEPLPRLYLRGHARRDIRPRRQRRVVLSLAECRVGTDYSDARE
eukprot:6395085-Prymnesium_polylepis.2